MSLTFYSFFSLSLSIEAFFAFEDGFLYHLATSPLRAWYWQVEG